MATGTNTGWKAGLAVVLILAAAAAYWAYTMRGRLAEKDAQIAASAASAARAARAAKAASDDLAQMKARETELRASLQGEIANRDVEIDRLRDRLSVRVLDRILFRSGSAQIRRAGRRLLAKLGPTLAKGSERIRVEGHTDNVRIGDRLRERYPSNWELSTARAASVVRFLQEEDKIDPKRLEAIGFGEYRPVAPNASVASRQRNRRVEIVLTPAHRGEPEPAPVPAKTP